MAEVVREVTCEEGCDLRSAIEVDLATSRASPSSGVHPVLKDAVVLPSDHETDYLHTAYQMVLGNGHPMQTGLRLDLLYGNVLRDPMDPIGDPMDLMVLIGGPMDLMDLIGDLPKVLWMDLLGCHPMTNIQTDTDPRTGTTITVMTERGTDDTAEKGAGLKMTEMTEIKVEDVNPDGAIRVLVRIINRLKP